MPHHLALIGYGYTARALSKLMAADGWRITGSTRRASEVTRIEDDGHSGFVYDSEANTDDDSLRDGLADVSHLFVSAPPGARGDRIAEHLDRILPASGPLAWIGYGSTTGVYGNRDGEWVEETTPPKPENARSVRRARAEAAWQALGQRHDLTVDIFRLAGIYGPGRSAFDRLRRGNQQRIIKPGQVFSRIHVDDIALIVQAAISLARPAGARAGMIFNVADDLPAPPQDVIAHAARLIGLEPPPAVALEDADLSPMAASFYAENKRVSNGRIHDVLGVSLSYPTYREGLAAILAGEQGTEGS